MQLLTSSLRWGLASGLGLVAAGCDAPAEPTYEPGVAVAVGEPAAGPPTALGTTCADRRGVVEGFLVADAQGHAVRAYGVEGGLQRTFGEAQLEEPFDVSWGPAGDLYVADFSSSAVLRFDGRTRAYVGVAYHDRQVLEEPMVLRGTADALVTLGNDTSNVTVTTVHGELQAVFGDPSLLWPVAMALDEAEGWVYVGRAGTEGPRVERYSVTGGPRTGEFGEGLGLGTIRGLATGCGEVLYATSDDALLRFRLEADGDAVLVKHWDVPEAGRLRQGPDGDLYVLAGDLLLRLRESDALEVALAFEPEVAARGFEFARAPNSAEFGL